MSRSPSPLWPGWVSVIIPVHNRPQLLREAVASVLAQTHTESEAIIVDDESTDNTRAVAEELARSNSERVRVLHVRNGGPGLAREAGRLAARGEFIQHLDSDDLLLPRKFELQISALRARPECGVAYAKTRYVELRSPQSAHLSKRTGEEIAWMFPSFLQSRWWDTPTPLYRRTVTDAAGPWTSLRNEEDWEYDCRIAAMGVRLAFVPEFLSEVRDHDGNRLSRGGTESPEKLSDRARAHALILGHARRAGLSEACPEMRHFARELFLLARQCGAAGLSLPSGELFELARAASGPRRSAGWDFKLYWLATAVFGWTTVGRFACSLDRRRT